MMRKRYIGLLLIIGLALFSGCLEEKDSVSVPTHPEGWTDQTSVDFHGLPLVANTLRKESCQSCHGDNFMGGSSGVSCYGSGCHAVFPHPPGFAATGSAEFHAEFIEEVLKWDILSCRSCHGDDYSGMGVSSKNCLTCHSTEGGPEACNLCHGDMTNPAPPKDLSGNTSTRSQGVGAHQAHLTGSTWSTFTMGCGNCHNVPAMYSSAGHIDDGDHAEINFSNLATFNGNSAATYSRLEASCDNVYCHGGFEFKKSESSYPWAYTEDAMTGNDPKVFWNQGNNGQVICGSCHGLPPKGHVAASSCQGCHGDVVNENFEIINKHLHINGKVEVFGNMMLP